MRMMMDITFPCEQFNREIRDKTLNHTLQKILEEMKAEAVFFTEKDGQRGAVLLVDVEEPSQVPALAEPWFLTFNADVKFRIVMTPRDLKNAHIENIGSRYA